MTHDTATTRTSLKSILMGGFIFFGCFLLAWVTVVRGNYLDYVIPPALLFANAYLLHIGLPAREFWGNTARPLAIALLGFAILSAIAAFRVVSLPPDTIQELKPFIFSGVFFLAVFIVNFFRTITDPAHIDWIRRAVMGGWLFGLLILVGEFSTQFILGLLNSPGNPGNLTASDFNRGVIILAALSWLAVPYLKPKLGAIGALAPVVLFWVASMFSQSQTIQIGLPISVFVYLAALWGPTLSRNVLAGGAAVLLATAPIAYQALFRIAPGIPGLSEKLFLDRAEIWDGVSRLVLDAPIFGHGFYTTKRAGTTFLEYIYFSGSNVAHPHNAFLEIWADLGFAGVIFGLVLLYSIWRGLRGLSPAVLPAALGGATVLLLVLLLSHSMWSPWIIGFLAFFAGFLSLIDQSLSRGGASSS